MSQTDKKVKTDYNHVIIKCIDTGTHTSKVFVYEVDTIDLFDVAEKYFGNEWEQMVVLNEQEYPDESGVIVTKDVRHVYVIEWLSITKLTSNSKYFK